MHPARGDAEEGSGVLDGYPLPAVPCRCTGCCGLQAAADDLSEREPGRLPRGVEIIGKGDARLPVYVSKGNILRR